MATKRDLTEFDSPGMHVIDKPLDREMEDSFLEYAYSVITARALPDVRDGLKPVHRRTLYGMHQMGLRPSSPFVKSARVVGEVMGRFHPHGDGAIYDAMVRLTQSFNLNLPLVDGHGNFGTLDDSAAASRYTEVKMGVWGERMVDGLDEDAVDFVPNYDGSFAEPSVLPAAFPNLLVNGSSGIAVGMAGALIPHNLSEVMAAARWLLTHPNASLDRLMEFIPGPDLPTGGLLLGMDEVRRAYETGRGKIKMRARSRITDVPGSRGRKQIEFYDLPYGVGTEKIIEAIKKQIGEKRLQGIADVKDLTDRETGTLLVVEAKVGVNPDVLRAALLKYTPLQTTFGIINLALVDGTPHELGLRDLLSHWVDHRIDVTRRRSQYRRTKMADRLHLVQGLLTVLLDIDKAIALIRAAENTAAARVALIDEFALSDVQTEYILDTPLRRLTKYDRITLQAEVDDLTAKIADLDVVLSDDTALRALVGKEMDALAKANPTPRLTTLVSDDEDEVIDVDIATVQANLELPDTPCLVHLSATGLLVRAGADGTPDTTTARRTKHDVFTATVRATTRGDVLAITSAGRAVRVPVAGIPETLGPSASGGVKAAEMVALSKGEEVVTLAAADGQGHGLALGTRDGIVKVQAGSWPVRGEEFPVIGLKGDDRVVAGAWMDSPEAEFAFVTSDAQVLIFGADSVRPQGAGTGGGVAGIRLADGASVVGFAVIAAADADSAHVLTTNGATAKVTPLTAYPRKGRATGGVRVQRFLKGEPDRLAVAAITARVAGCSETGTPVSLPAVDERRDGSGAAVESFSLTGHTL